jgi:PAS domain S-box-containing protein
MSVPAARAAIQQAVDTGNAAATAAFRLTQQDESDRRMGLVIYQAIYDGDMAAVGQRRAALRGVVFVTLTMDTLLNGIAGQVPAYLRLCLVDVDPLVPRRRLSGRPGCETERPRLYHERPIVFAGRQLEVRVSATPGSVPGSTDHSVLTIAAVGVLSAAMLGASLLITTGRTRRIESAVRERTAALRAEVSERQAVETALRASEQRFRNIIDNVPIGVVYTDLAGRVIQANPRYCELTGYDEAELAALSPEALTHPEDLANDEMLTAQLVAGEIPMYRRHKRCLNRAGDVVWVRSTVSLLRDGNNEPWRIVGVVEDITEHLRLEEAERAREAAEVSNRAKSDFLSRMSHELRTPLNAMLGFAQLLEIDRHHPLTATQRPWVGQIQQAGWHLLEMINDVLDLSRIDSGNLRLQTATLDLAELVERRPRSSPATRPSAASGSASSSRPTRRRSSATRRRVKQILTNLLSNAVKYNVDDGRVHIASRLSTPDVIEVSVTDTGMGMTPEQMEELFRPFKPARPRAHGAAGDRDRPRHQPAPGRADGRLDPGQERPGKGSSFILEAAQGDRPGHGPLGARRPRGAAGRLSPAHRPLHRGQRDQRRGHARHPGAAGQVQLEVSVTGLDGLAAVRARLPHLILLDMHLPDISGLELLRHLKADPATATIPVIVVSADATAQQVDAALDAGAVRYLTKPLAVNELLATIDDLLDRMDTGFS